MDNHAAYGTPTTARVHHEPDDPLRTPFVVDRHRVIECTAFRRLEGKTQVFSPDHHDHFRTRLTHTLEVANIARCLAVGLGANEALAEVITLAHDLGHPPFGHAGEAALADTMASAGGFNHNTHSLRVVEYLEHPYPPFRGLNLTAAVRHGLADHATPYDQPAASESTNPAATAGPSLEASIASLADRIAYGCHDLEDAIGAGFITLDDLADLPCWQAAHDEAKIDPGATNLHAMRRAVLNRLLDGLLTDAIQTSRTPLGTSGENDQRDPQPVRLSRDGEAGLVGLNSFLLKHVYRHPEVMAMDAKGRRAVTALFETYRRKPEYLPKRFRLRIGDQGLDHVICDYVAGMTDRFCQIEHDRFVGGCS